MMLRRMAMGVGLVACAACDRPGAEEHSNSPVCAQEAPERNQSCDRDCSTICFADEPQGTKHVDAISTIQRVFLGADDEQVLMGGSTLLRWDVPEATSCSVDANGHRLWSGTTGVGDTATYGGAIADTTYTLSCQMSSGAHLSGSVTVRVVLIHATPQNIPFDSPTGSVVAWNVPGATSCLVWANGYALWGGTQASGNTTTYGRLTQDTVYTVRCSSPSGPVSASTTVRVPIPPRVTPDFASMKGANIFSGRYFSSETPQLVGTLMALNANFARLPLNLSEAVRNRTEADFLEKTQASLDALANNNMKAIVVLAGYSTYELAPPPCTTYLPFVDVRHLAAQLVTNLGNHAALYAYELNNEAVSTQAWGEHCAPGSVIKATNEMYGLVKSINPSVPTTVSEAWYPNQLANWSAISSFWSYHIYPGATTPLNAIKLDAVADRIVADFAYIRLSLSPKLPVVLGEFGYPRNSLRSDGLNPTEIAQYYRRVHEAMRAQNVGSFFWNLSRYDRSFSVMNYDFSLTPAGYAVRDAFARDASPPIYIFSNPSTVSLGDSSVLTWDVPTADTCTVWANGYALWKGKSGTGHSSTYGALTRDTDYELRCTMPGGVLKTATTRVYVENAHLSASPSIIRSGSRPLLTWNVPRATACTVSHEGRPAWSGTSGTVQAFPATTQTSYTLSCTMQSGGQASDTASIYVR